MYPALLSAVREPVSYCPSYRAFHTGFYGWEEWEEGVKDQVFKGLKRALSTYVQTWGSQRWLNSWLLTKGARRHLKQVSPWCFPSKALCYCFLNLLSSDLSVSQKWYQMHRYLQSVHFSSFGLPFACHLPAEYVCRFLHIKRLCPSGILSLVCGFIDISGEIQVSKADGHDERKKSFWWYLLDALTYFRDVFLACF